MITLLDNRNQLFIMNHSNPSNESILVEARSSRRGISPIAGLQRLNEIPRCVCYVLLSNKHPQMQGRTTLFQW